MHWENSFLFYNKNRLYTLKFFSMIKIISLYVCLFFCSSNYCPIKSGNHPADFSFTCFTNEDRTWGYDIVSSGKLFIHQPTIPAIPGQIGFIDKRSASKVAELVVKKLKEKPTDFPTINLEELKKLKIII